MTISVVIGHAAWAGELRRENFKRLEAELRPEYVHVSEVQEHANVWCKDLWQWASEQNFPTVILNDDVEVCPRFREVANAMVNGLGGREIALHTTFPHVDINKRPWLRSYWYTGPAVILTPSWAAYLLHFWDAHPELHDANEDMVGIYAAYESKLPYWHPLPSPVRHRTDIRSTLGYDKHPNRVTNIPWTDYPHFDLTDPDYWRHDPPRLEIPWMTDGQLRSLRKC